MTAITLSILGWFATICRATGMFVKGTKRVKFWTTLGNVLWLVVGLIQWLALDMSVTLAVSNAICVIVFIYAWYKSRQAEAREFCSNETSYIEFNNPRYYNRKQRRRAAFDRARKEWRFAL